VEVGCAIATLPTRSVTCDASVASPLRNFRRAGRLNSRSATSIVVPTGAPTSVTEVSFDASMTIRVAARSPSRRVVSVIRDTLAIDGRASPRKPMLESAHRSSTQRIFEVACRSKASIALVGLMPQPSSQTRTRVRPPATVSTVIVRAPASIALSTSSLTTEDGRSMTSPAAIWSITSAGNTAITAPRHFGSTCL